MAEKIYKIGIEVDGVPSGSEQLAMQQGQPTKIKPSTVNARDKFKRKTKQTILEELIGVERLKQLTTVAGGATAIAGVTYSLYKQNATFKGDSNTIAKLGTAEMLFGSAAVIVGATIKGATVGGAAGAAVGGALALAAVAVKYAKDNRELINKQQIDSFQSNYYQRRLIDDISGRSR